MEPPVNRRLGSEVTPKTIKKKAPINLHTHIHQLSTHTHLHTLGGGGAVSFRSLQTTMSTHSRITCLIQCFEYTLCYIILIHNYTSNVQYTRYYIYKIFKYTISKILLGKRSLSVSVSIVLIHCSYVPVVDSAVLHLSRGVIILFQIRGVVRGYKSFRECWPGPNLMAPNYRPYLKDSMGVAFWLQFGSFS